MPQNLGPNLAGCQLWRLSSPVGQTISIRLRNLRQNLGMAMAEQGRDQFVYGLVIPSSESVEI